MAKSYKQLEVEIYELKKEIARLKQEKIDNERATIANLKKKLDEAIIVNEENQKKIDELGIQILKKTKNLIYYFLLMLILTMKMLTSKLS